MKISSALTLACLAFISRSDGVIRRGYSSYCGVLHCTEHADLEDVLNGMQIVGSHSYGDY